MKKFTVLLMRPEYTADNYGEDTYMTHVVAESVAAAQKLAQKEAFGADDCEEEEGYSDNHIDYSVLMVIEGHHNDIKEPT